MMIATNLTSILFKNDYFVFGKLRSFLKTTHSFWTFRKRITIVFENDRFLKLTIVNETTNLIKTVLFEKNDRLWKKKYCNLNTCVVCSVWCVVRTTNKLILYLQKGRYSWLMDDTPDKRLTQLINGWYKW